MVSVLLDSCLQLPGSYAQKFHVFAEGMLRQASLRCGEESFRLMEVEVYFTSADHPDPFTHGDELQNQPDVWYWHRKGTTYIENSFKGLDITLGNTGRKGGLLIRSIFNTRTGQFIEGASKVVDTLLAGLKCRTVAVAIAKLAYLHIYNGQSPLPIY